MVRGATESMSASKPRVGVILRESITARASTNRCVELDDIKERYKALQGQMKKLKTAVKQRHNALKDTGKARASMAQAMAALSQDSPLTDNIAASIAAMGAVAKKSQDRADEFEKFVVDYLEEWYKTLTTRLDEDIKHAENLRRDAEHYDHKVDSLQANKRKLEQQDKPQVTQATLDKLDRNQSKHLEAQESYQHAAKQLYVLMEELVDNSWRDLHPLVLKLINLDMNLTHDNENVLESFDKTIADLKQLRTQHNLPKNRFEDFENGSPQQLSTIPTSRHKQPASSSSPPARTTNSSHKPKTTSPTNKETLPPPPKEKEKEKRPALWRRKSFGAGSDFPKKEDPPVADTSKKEKKRFWNRNKDTRAPRRNSTPFLPSGGSTPSNSKQEPEPYRSKTQEPTSSSRRSSSKDSDDSNKKKKKAAWPPPPREAQPYSFKPEPTADSTRESKTASSSYAPPSPLENKAPSFRQKGPTKSSLYDDDSSSGSERDISIPSGVTIPTPVATKKHSQTSTPSSKSPVNSQPSKNVPIRSSPAMNKQTTKDPVRSSSVGKEVKTPNKIEGNKQSKAVPVSPGRNKQRNSAPTSPGGNEQSKAPPVSPGGNKQTKTTSTTSPKGNKQSKTVPIPSSGGNGKKPAIPNRAPRATGAGAKRDTQKQSSQASHTKNDDYLDADPSKWVQSQDQFSGGFVFESKGETEEIMGSIQQGISKFRDDPQKYLIMFYQTNMMDWPNDQQRYILIHREGSVGYKPTGLSSRGPMTVLTNQYQRLPPFPNNELPVEFRDDFTDSMVYERRKLHSKKNIPVVPGRGMGVGDTPLLKIIGDVDPSDIHQGSVGDCWLLSGISSLAEFDGAVKHMFRKTTNLEQRPLPKPNLYVVTLWDLETWTERDIVIDERLPVKADGSGQLLASKPSEDGELWVCYLEKALAIHCGGWDKITGGQCTHAWALMTGCKNQYSIQKNPKTGLFACYGKYNPNERRWARRANSPHDGEQMLWPNAWPGTNEDAICELTQEELFMKMCEWDDTNYIVGASCTSKAGDSGLVDNHAYSVIECHNDVAGTDVDLIKVRNPWGKGEIEDGEFDDDGPGWDKYPQVKAALNPVIADDGIFYVTKQEFFVFFSTIYLSASDMTEFVED